MPEEEKRGVAINPFAQPHYTDHLAPICEMMNIPYLLSDSQCIEQAKRYYPSLNIQEIDYQEFQPSYLIQNYDVLFYSDLWDRDVFRKKFAPLEQEYGKKIRGIHCPHGYSDKAYYLKKTAEEEIALIYGLNMLDMFKAEKVWDHLGAYVVTGNIRYTYYKKHKRFFDDIVEKEVFAKFPTEQPTILYAPTWKDVEEATSFFNGAEELLQSLPKEYNILVKLHPQLEQDDTAAYYRLLGKFEKQPHILFVKDIPLVYPLLERTDIYFGDMSSIGYDFLVYNRPLFFLNPHRWDFNRDRRMFLTQCGYVLNPEDYKNAAKIIERALPKDSRFSIVRKEIYEYTFFTERTFEEIQRDIVRVYNS